MSCSQVPGITLLLKPGCCLVIWVCVSCCFRCVGQLQNAFFFFHPPPQWKWETSHLLCSDLANCAMPMFKFCQMSWNVVSQWGRDSLSSPFERGREGMQWKAFGHQQWIQLLPVSLLSFYLLKYFYNTEVTYKAVAFLIFLTHFSSPSLHVPSHHTFICYLFKLFWIM